MSRNRDRRRYKSDGLNVHHVRPSSRNGGGHNNLVLLPVEFHANWHKLFVNMTVAEAHAFIDEVMTPGSEWSYKRLDQLRRHIMFGGSR